MKKIKELDALLVTNEELKETIESIGWKTFIFEIKRGFEQSALGQAVVPEKVYADIGVSDMSCMPAYLPRYNILQAHRRCIPGFDYCDYGFCGIEECR